MTVPIYNEMFYIFQDLHKLPHGHHENREKSSFDEQCVMYNINNIDLRKINNPYSYPIFLVNKNGKAIKSFQEIKIDKILFIETLLKHGAKNHSRDKSNTISKRMNIGFSQPQPNSVNSRFEDNQCLPFFSDKYYMKLNSILIPQIGQVMAESQQILDSKFPNVMNDPVRRTFLVITWLVSSWLEIYQDLSS